MEKIDGVLTVIHDNKENTFSKLEIEGDFFNLTNSTYKKIFSKYHT